ncbi:MAG: hypothetical protein ACKPB8_04555 [Alphaproteobacteria bacterium]
MRKPASPPKTTRSVRKPVAPARVARKIAGKAAAVPLTEAPATKPQPISSKNPTKPKKIRKEDISFSVPQAFRKKFKQAAKEAGHKKSDFLQILLLHWEERQRKPPSGDSL